MECVASSVASSVAWVSCRVVSAGMVGPDSERGCDDCDWISFQVWVSMIEYCMAPSRVGETADRACAAWSAAFRSTDTTDRMGNTRSTLSNPVLGTCEPSPCVTDCDRSLPSTPLWTDCIDSGREGIATVPERFRGVPGREFGSLVDIVPRQDRCWGWDRSPIIGRTGSRNWLRSVGFVLVDSNRCQGLNPKCRAQTDTNAGRRTVSFYNECTIRQQCEVIEDPPEEVQ